MTKNSVLKEKVRESLSSVLPITIIVLLMSLTVTPLPNYLFILFFVGAVFMTVGTALFSLGAEQSMSRIGEYVGAQMAKSRKIWIMAVLTAFIGFVVTVSEPDLSVLASYVQSIQPATFVVAVSVGVGVFLSLAVIRIVFNIKVKYILLASYGVAFILAFFTFKGFWPVAFDAGGVTTGAMSVPFIISIGAGISSISSGKSGDDDNFGLMAICSVGPVIAVLILGLISGGSTSQYTPPDIVTFDNSKEMGLSFITALPKYFFEVAKGILPILIFFLVYQFIMSPVSKKELWHITLGAVTSYIGIVLFLTGANVGFMPIGRYLGETIGGSEYKLLIVPIGMIFGYFAVSAEPAVKVLEEQVESATAGLIPRKALARALSIGVGIATGIAMLRAVTGISIIWFVGFCYLASLTMSFFVPGTFTSIAFDAGGAASGAMTATFLFPLSIGACVAAGGNVMESAFGVIALVAAAPAVTIQILGIVYKKKTDAARKQSEFYSLIEDTEIIEFNCIKEEI